MSAPSTSAPTIPMDTLSLVFKVLQNAVSNSSDLSKYGKINLEGKAGGRLRQSPAAMSLLTDAGFIIVDSYLVLLEVIDATEATLSTVVALRCASAAPAPDHFYNNNNTITSNHFHNKLKGRNGVAAVLEFFGSNFVHNEKCRLAKGLDECGRTPLALLAALAKKKSHTLTSTAVNLVYYNEDALITRDKEGKTPIDIALGSGACAEIIGLLSHTPEEARSLDWKGVEEMNLGVRRRTFRISLHALNWGQCRWEFCLPCLVW